MTYGFGFLSDPRRSLRFGAVPSATLKMVPIGHMSMIPVALYYMPLPAPGHRSVGGVPQIRSGGAPAAACRSEQQRPKMAMARMCAPAAALAAAAQQRNPCQPMESGGVPNSLRRRASWSASLVAKMGRKVGRWANRAWSLRHHVSPHWPVRAVMYSFLTLKSYNVTRYGVARSTGLMEAASDTLQWYVAARAATAVSMSSSSPPSAKVSSVAHTRRGGLGQAGLYAVSQSNQCSGRPVDGTSLRRSPISTEETTPHRVAERCPWAAIVVMCIASASAAVASWCSRAVHPRARSPRVQCETIPSAHRWTASVAGCRVYKPCQRSVTVVARYRRVTAVPSVLRSSSPPPPSRSHALLGYRPGLGLGHWLGLGLGGGLWLACWLGLWLCLWLLGLPMRPGRVGLPAPMHL